MQVYTRFHIIQSDPGAEVGDCGGFSVCICAECVIAISHAGIVCWDPSPTQLGARALHHRLPRYEVWFLISDHLMAKSKPCLINITQPKRCLWLHGTQFWFVFLIWCLELTVHTAYLQFYWDFKQAKKPRLKKVMLKGSWTEKSKSLDLLISRCAIKNIR